MVHVCRRAAPARCTRHRVTANDRPDRRSSAGPRLRRDPRCAVRSGPGLLTQTCGPVRREGGAARSLSAARGRRHCGGRSSSIPKNRVHDERVPHQVGRGHRGHRSVDRARAEARARPGSIWAARTVRARSGGCCEKNGWPRPATASASRTPSNRRSRSTRPCRMPTSASACITTTPTSPPPRSACCDGCCSCPAVTASKACEEMLRARSDGQLLQSEADYQLHLIYLWYEKQPQRALQLLRGLRDRHPEKSAVRAAHRRDPGRLPARSAGQPRHTWQALLEAAQARRVAEPAMTEATARLGLAGVLDRLSESDISHATPARDHRDEAAPAPSASSRARSCKLGQMLDRLGRRDDALTRVSRRARRACRQTIQIASSAQRELDFADDERRDDVRRTMREHRAIVDRSTHVSRRSIRQSSIVNRRLRCSDRSLVPTLDIVGAIGRVVGYRDDTIF